MKTNLKNIPFIVIFIIFIFTLYFIFKSVGLAPTIITDEYYYSRYSRLVPLSEAGVPSYLYLKIFSITSYCGNGFLECAKVLNSFFFSCSFAFIFLIVRSFSNTKYALLVGFLALLGPVNSFTAYFMPESLAFLFFWMFIWYLLKITTSSKLLEWCLLGTILGLATLIKIHAIFYLPATIFYILLIFYRDKNLFSIDCFLRIFLFVTSIFIIKLGLSYLLAGDNGLTFFGKSYSNLGPKKFDFSSFLLNIITNFIGHLAFLILLFGLPILISFSKIKDFIFKDINDDKEYIQFINICFFSITFTISITFIISVFTGYVSNIAPSETPYRIHLRYYSYVFPFFYMVAVGAIHYSFKLNKNIYNIIAIILFSAISIICIKNNFNPYTPSFIDSPELYGIISHKINFIIFVFFIILSLIILFFKSKQATILYILLTVPLFLFFSSTNVSLTQRGRIDYDINIKTGIIVKNYLNNDSINNLHVIGSDVLAILRVLFYLDNPLTTFELVDKNSIINLNDLPKNRKWLLLVGDQIISENNYFKLKLVGSTLFKLNESFIINFKDASISNEISHMAGISVNEKIGRWSTEKYVTFTFSEPLPEKFILELRAYAYENNINKNFLVKIGSTTSEFKLTKYMDNVNLTIDNPTNSNTLVIAVPNPTSPFSLGLGEDKRNLGLVISTLSIKKINN